VVTGILNESIAFTFRVKKMKATAPHTFETSVTIYQLAPRNVPEDLNPQG
jgi:hypothetical protein